MYSYFFSLALARSLTMCPPCLLSSAYRMSDFLLEKRFLMLLCGAKVIKYAVAPIFLVCVLH